MIRSTSTPNTARLAHIHKDVYDPDARLVLHYGDLSSLGQLSQLISDVEPDEVYHLGSQSHVHVSFEMPEYTGEITGVGATRLLEAIRTSGSSARFYQASSSEMFGNTPPPQNETSRFSPRSPYAASKLYAHWMTVTYREGYKLFASSGILFNHESPRRSETFVTRKISKAVARIKAGEQEKLFLGNLDAKRDWGYAPEYVEGIWSILQQPAPDDYVFGTGESHTIREFVEEAFGYAGLDWRKHVETDSQYVRPAEIHDLRADSSKARERLGWSPKVSFRELVWLMVDADLEAVNLPAVGDGKATVIREFGTWHSWANTTAGMPTGTAARLDPLPAFKRQQDSESRSDSPE